MKPVAVAAAIDILRQALREESPQAFYDNAAYRALLSMPEAVEAALDMVSVPQITADEIERRRWQPRAGLARALVLA